MQMSGFGAFAHVYNTWVNENWNGAGRVRLYAGGMQIRCHVNAVCIFVGYGAQENC